MNVFCSKYTKEFCHCTEKVKKIDKGVYSFLLATFAFFLAMPLSALQPSLKFPQRRRIYELVNQVNGYLTQFILKVSTAKRRNPSDRWQNH